MSQFLYDLLSDKLDEIAALYKVHPRITLIVRMPGKHEECAFLSDDAWPDAVATVERLYGDAKAFRAGPPEPTPEAAPASGSVSTVRSDDPPAKPLPTCGNCGSNFITPAPAADAVREAAELLRFEIDALPRPDLKYATLNTEAVRTLLAALDAREPDETAEACRRNWGTGAGLRAEGKP